MNLKLSVESFLSHLAVLVWLGLAIWIRSAGPITETRQSVTSPTERPAVAVLHAER